MAGPRPSLSEYRIPSIPDSMFYIHSFISKEEETHILSTLYSPPVSKKWIALSHRRLQAWPSVLSKQNVLLDAPLPTWLESPIVERMSALGVFTLESSEGGGSSERDVDGEGEGEAKLEGERGFARLIGRGRPNHVLVNEYEAGQGIMPHEDGAAYAEVVATVSLGGTIMLDVVEKDSDSDQHDDAKDGNDGGHDKHEVEKKARSWRVLQEPRSLLVTMGPVYKSTLHGIESVTIDEDLGPQTVANWGLLGDSKGIEERGGRNVRETRVSLTFRDVLKVSKAGSRILGRTR